MLTGKMTPGRKLRFALKFAKTTALRRPRLVNLEVTKFCNAKCDFCDYWHTKVSPSLDDYVEVIRKINPVVVSITGGEPLLRKDLPRLIRRIHENMFFVYIGMITNGSLLTVTKARELWDAGLDQLSISMNHLGQAHDRERGIPGLFDHVSKLVARLPAVGLDNVQLNVVIMEDNLKVIPQIVGRAHQWGVKVSFSAYTSLKTGNSDHLVSRERMRKLEDLVEELKDLKRRLKNIVSSTYYLDRVPAYFRNGGVGGCRAGQKFIQVTPDGYLKACSEMPATQRYTDYKRWKYRQQCTSCWYGCRGESQVPVTMERVRELLL